MAENLKPLCMAMGLFQASQFKKTVVLSGERKKGETELENVS
jgi:hypothetical protein